MRPTVVIRYPLFVIRCSEESFISDNDQARWRRELMEKMFLTLGELRPPVLPGTVRGLLADLLGFRHLFRHAYDFTLDEPRTRALWQRWQTEGLAVRAGLAEFASRLPVVL